MGGVGPYLTRFARAGTSQEAADHAVAELEIHELPSARGCTYVLPRSEFALGLQVGENLAGRDLAPAQKPGVTREEIDKLCAAVTKALAKGALEPDRIRAATGTASRSLGEAGKKKGITTTLPLALGLLQARGEIRRVPVHGRLDQQRYLCALWKPSPLARRKGEAGDPFTRLARRYVSWVGPATLAEFAWFCGLGKKATQAIVAPLELTPVAPGRWLIDPPSHAILDRRRLVGLWEYDAVANELVAATFVPQDKALRAAIQRTEAFVRDQLGDARSFSLDSPKSRAPKVEALRRMAGKA